MNDGLLLWEKITLSVPPCDRISTYMYILNTIHCLSLTPLHVVSGGPTPPLPTEGSEPQPNPPPQPWLGPLSPLVVVSFPGHT